MNARKPKSSDTLPAINKTIRKVKSRERIGNTFTLQCCFLLPLPLSRTPKQSECEEQRRADSLNKTTSLKFPRGEMAHFHLQTAIEKESKNLSSFDVMVPNWNQFKLSDTFGATH